MTVGIQKISFFFFIFKVSVVLDSFFRFLFSITFVFSFDIEFCVCQLLRLLLYTVKNKKNPITTQVTTVRVYISHFPRIPTTLDRTVSDFQIFGLSVNHLDSLLFHPKYIFRNLE